jgi:acetyltransferase-like isoleucine patch superfamily enzyme
MELNKDSLKWLLFGRKKMEQQVKGFHSHWNTSVSAESKFGEYVHLLSGASVSSSEVGRFSRINGAVISGVKVGAFSAIGQRSFVGGGGDHPLNQISHHSLFYSSNKRQHPHLILAKEDKYIEGMKKTIIGNDVWIGSDAIVKHGVTVGDGAVVAIGALVVKDVPPYAIVGGLPAKVIKYRHSLELRDALVESQWWNWPVAALQIISDEFDRDSPLTLEKFEQVKEKALVFLT